MSGHKRATKAKVVIHDFDKLKKDEMQSNTGRSHHQEATSVHIYSLQGTMSLIECKMGRILVYLKVVAKPNLS
jgi:hypothetical protein